MKSPRAPICQQERSRRLASTSLYLRGATTGAADGRVAFIWPTAID